MKTGGRRGRGEREGREEREQGEEGDFCNYDGSPVGPVDDGIGIDVIDIGVVQLRGSHVISGLV